MKTRLLISAAAVSLAIGLGAALPALLVPSAPAVAADAKKTLGEKVSKPLKEAQDLANAKKFDEAAAKVKEAEAVPNKTPYEVHVTAQIGTYVYANLKDYDSAAKAIEADIGSGEMPPDQVVARSKTLAQMYYQTKNYAKAIEWAQKYVDQSKDAEGEILVGQAYYIQKDYKNASDAMNQAVKLSEAKGEPPKEDWLNVLMSADFELHDNDALQSDLQLLVRYYPQPKYWEDLLNILEHKLKDNSHNALDVYRLMYAAGTMNSEDEFAEMADMALREGYPEEAKAVLQKGIAAGAVSRTGRHAPLIAKATQEADVDEKGFAKGAQEAASQPTGEAAVKFGEADWGMGQYDKSIQLIQLGLKKGVKNVDDAQLRLEMADLGAGDKAGAQQAFQAITPGTPAAQFGQLWMLLKGSTPAAAVQ